MPLRGLRKSIRNVEPYVPGLTSEEVQRRFALDRVIKLGSNENNYAPFPSVLAAMREELSRVHMYPDLAFKELKERIGELYGLEARHIALSHGAEGALQTLGKMYLDPGDAVVLGQETYGLYGEISRVMGAERITVPLKDFRVDLKALGEAVTPNTKLLWLANPNNPTGTLFPPEDLERLFEKLPPGAVVVMDEAYAEFADPRGLPDTPRLIREGYPVVGVRTFSKAYGLAGVRLGYLLGAPEVVEVFDVVSEPFNANRVALAGALAVLTLGRSEMETARERIIADRRRMEQALEALGCPPVPSSTNFVFCKVPCRGKVLAQHLLRRGVIIRSCEGWGFDTMVRITVGTSEEITDFLAILEDLLPRICGGELEDPEIIDVML